MGGKYEIRYYISRKKSFEDWENIGEIYTNSWFEFMKLRLTKKLIYFKVYL